MSADLEFEFNRNYVLRRTIKNLSALIAIETNRFYLPWCVRIYVPAIAFPRGIFCLSLLLLPRKTVIRP